MTAPITRDRMVEAIRELPVDATVDDAIERLVFLAKIEIGGGARLGCRYPRPRGINEPETSNQTAGVKRKDRDAAKTEPKRRTSSVDGKTS